MNSPDKIKKRIANKAVGAGGIGDRLPVRPMEAVAALYSEGHCEISLAILSSLSKAIFDAPQPRAASWLHRAVARFSYRVLKRTTTRVEAAGGAEDSAVFRNPILEQSEHPYAQSLLASSSRQTESLVEGGDPMNAQYMIIAPEIRRACTLWDGIFFNSVPGKDVQLRFIWETKATWAEAKARLDKGGPVRLKALAAGTGLSMILAYDRLLRDGCDPGRITVRITDRDPVNTAKTGLLLGKLAASRGWNLGSGDAAGISARTEDIFEDDPAADPAGRTGYDVVTAVGILEYLQGYTCETTERRLRLHEPEEPATAVHLAEKLGAMTAAGASLIVNTHRPHASTRILELFGKKFDYREETNMSALLATADFRPARLAGSALIYDVKVYEKM